MLETQCANDVDEPVLPRRRKASACIAVDTGDGHYASTPVEPYKPMHFATIDTIIACMKERFDQPGYQVYSCLEGVILKATD